MNRLSAFGFILTGVLAIFFLVVVSDIPNFGDPNTPATKYVRLFGLAETGARGDSEAGSRPRRSGRPNSEKRVALPLSELKKSLEGRDEWNAYVRKREFFYPDEEKYYFIRKEGKE